MRQLMLTAYVCIVVSQCVDQINSVAVCESYVAVTNKAGMINEYIPAYIFSCCGQI